MNQIFYRLFASGAVAGFQLQPAVACRIEQACGGKVLGRVIVLLVVKTQNAIDKASRGIDETPHPEPYMPAALRLLGPT